MVETKKEENNKKDNKDLINNFINQKEEEFVAKIIKTFSQSYLSCFSNISDSNCNFYENLNKIIFPQMFWLKNVFIKEKNDKESFSAMINIFADNYLTCFNYISETDLVLTKKFYSKLVENSKILEDFLDFHGAKSNKDWYFYRELSAASRHLSLAGYDQNHIISKLAFYDLPETYEFIIEGEKNLNFVNITLKKLAPIIIQESKRLGIKIPLGTYHPFDFPSIAAGEMLDFDIDAEEEENKEQNKEAIVKISSEFLEITRQFARHVFYNPFTFEEIEQEIIPHQINEAEIRKYEMKIHNLQSFFDSYVLYSGSNGEFSKLKRFRSFFSVVFHLLKMMGRFLHFYERHICKKSYKNTYKQVRDKLLDIIDIKMLLDRTVNYGLYFVCHFLNLGKPLAKELLSEYGERSFIKVGIPKNRGFHCRPSTLVTRIVEHYGGEVFLIVNESKFDASSVTDLLWAGGKIQNENITSVVFEGYMASLKDIEILANVNYGEDIMGTTVSLPSSLAYLKKN